MIFKSRRERLAWWGVVILAYGSLAVTVTTTIETTPIPLRFQEAANAFLYGTSIAGGLVAIIAVVSLVTGIWSWFITFKLYQNESPKVTRWTRPGVLLQVGLGVILALFAIPLLWRDSVTYKAFTENGFIGRNYWTGSIETETWSSLHHVELGCNGMRRFWPEPAPVAFLHFPGGRSVGSVLTMTPFRISREQALVRLEELRGQNQAPIIWRSSFQQERFRNGDEEIIECADRFLSHFPADKRSAMIAMLRSDAEFRK
jgi:hypothetical protein